MRLLDHPPARPSARPPVRPPVRPPALPPARCFMNLMEGPRDCLMLWSQGLPHIVVPRPASYCGPKSCPMHHPNNMKIVRAHNLTHMRAQNFSTTAPGPKFRDLQVYKNPSGPNLGPIQLGPIWVQSGAQSGPFWGPILGYFWAQGGVIVFQGGYCLQVQVSDNV